MAEFEEKLNAILSASLAQALTGEHAGESAPPPAAEPAEAGPAGEAAGQSGATDWSALLGMLGGGGDSNPLSALSELDPQLLQAGLRLFSEYSATDDRKVALLNALKPFVKPERYAKVDRLPSWPGSSGWPSSSSRAAERRGRTMYNRYIPNGASYTRVVEEDAPPTQTVPPDAPPPEPDAEAPESAKPASGLGKLLRGLKLDGLDTGDVLLLLILLFLFLEGDDMELVITLGLLLLLGLE